MQFCRTFLFLFLALGSSAQQLSFFKPDNLKQLPSSESYNIMQDSRGYIWFSTEGGLCRFNGSTVKVFAAAEGLPEGATYTVSEDKKGRIWLTTSENRILYIDPPKDSIIEAPFSKNYADQCNKRLEHAYTTKQLGDSILWISTQHRSYHIDLRTNKITDRTIRDSIELVFYEFSGGLLQHKTLIDSGFVHKIHTVYLTIHGQKKLCIPVPYYKPYSPDFRSFAVTNTQGDHFISFGNFLIQVKHGGTYKITELSHPIICLYIDKDNGLWIGTHKAGAIYMPDTNAPDSRIVNLSDLSVSGVCEDAEKGVWCTTLEKGVFYCRNKYVLGYANVPGLEKRTELLKAMDDRLYTSAIDNELVEIRKDTLLKRQFPGRPIPTDIIRYGDTLVIAGPGYQLKSDTNFRKPAILFNAKSNLMMGANHVTLTSDHRVFSINRTSLMEIIGTKFVVRINLMETTTRTLLATRGGRLLIGCMGGLVEVDLKNYSVKKIKGIKSPVSKIIETKSEGIWITTKENGIYVLDKDSAKKISDLLHLPTERFNDIAQDERGDFWLASNIGLIHLGKPFSKQNTKTYNMLNGLNSTEILQVAVAGDRVFLSTYEGLCSFPLSYDLSNNTPPSIYVRRVKVNENRVALTPGLTLAWNENNLKILYDVLTFKRGDLPMKLFYRIEGLDNRVHSFEGRELLLSNLSPGFYRVQTFALNNDGKASITPAVVEFTIRKPFWLTPIFIIASILVLAALIFLIVNRIIFRIQRKEEEKTRVNKLLAEYQMSALRAQMNPHFIFNCINSIQRYILTNKAEEAYNYLAKFSKLIRLVLNYAEENLISLAQELEIVELYIELEQLRFENKFTYRIEMGKNIDVNEVTVPVMIMQPYIENAIWHGLMNLDKGKAGHIYIQLSLDDNLLQVVIEDNGIGVERSLKLKKKDHRSKGTKINSKRAEILNIISSGTKGSVMIEDIKSNGSVEGTRVIITIPQNNVIYE